MQYFSRNTVYGLMASCALINGANAQTESTAAETSGSSGSAIAIEEIVVTATKREERVRDIAASITAFNEEGLEALGAQSFEDYLTRTPGVVFNQAVPGNSTAIIRGVATTTGIAQAQGTTAYFINEVPMTDPFYSAGIPDIDTFDVDNIVVMRGPQGTLFGSSSLGGAINYQAARPDLEQFGAHFRGSYGDVHNGESGYDANLMLNVPIVGEKLAIRGVYGQKRVAGFIDNLGTGEQDSNRTDIDGGRILVTFAPTDLTSINYLFLDQTSETQDAGAAQSSLGEYAKSTLIAEPFSYSTTIHNLRLDQEFSFATLTATASRHEKEFSGTQDFSGLVPDFLAPAAFLEPGDSEGDTFEVRLASPTSRKFEYLIGAYYDSTTENVVNQLVSPSAEPLFGTAVLIDALVEIDGRESALFGEARHRFTDALQLTVGGRYFRTELDTVTTQGGPLSGPTTVTPGSSEETGFSPKISLQWSPDDDLLVYGLISQGFRFGGPNIARDPAFEIPPQFDSDQLTNYELGARSTMLGGELLLDGTLYWVDWDDIQVTQSSPGGFTYTANAGKARNRGFELSATYQPIASLGLHAAATYLDATLGNDFGSGASTVPAGSQLPGASKWQVSDSLIYTPGTDAFSPSIALSHRYISSAPGELTPDPVQQGGYNLFDLRLGAEFGDFGLSVFVENIGDVRGVSRAVTTVGVPVEYLVQPRTIGLTIDYRM